MKRLGQYATLAHGGRIGPAAPIVVPSVEAGGRIAAVVPAKGLREAKSRLAPALTPEGRARLAAAMLAAVVGVLTRQSRISEVIVVTSDPVLAEAARSCGAIICPDTGGGLNEAIASGANLARQHGASRVLVLPGDVPLVTAADVARVLGSRAQVIVPSRDRDGTNALLLDLPLQLAPAFGTDSFSRHLDAAAALELELLPMEVERIAFDVDSPEDLSRLVSEPAFAWLGPVTDNPTERRLVPLQQTTGIADQ